MKVKQGKVKRGKVKRGKVNLIIYIMTAAVGNIHNNMNLTFKVFELYEGDDWEKTTKNFDYGQIVMKESPDTRRTWHWIVIFDDGRPVTEWEYDKEIHDYISENIPCIINYQMQCQAEHDRGELCECKLAREYDHEFTWISDTEFDLMKKAVCIRPLVNDERLDDEPPNKRKRSI